MSDEDPALDTELAEVEARLRELRDEVADLGDDLRDYDDSGIATRLLGERAAMIEALEARREELLRRLDAR